MVNIYQKLSERFWLLACLALSAGVQLSFITKSSIWHDEGYSLLLAPQNLADILTRTARDVHPPLYYLTLHFWTNLFGTSELAARSLSALFILLTMIVMFALVKRLFGGGAARTTVLFMAIAPFLVRYGQEARMYAMAAFLIGLSTYLLVTALDLQNKKRLYLYAAVLALALYTHYYAVFIVPVHWLYVLSRTNWRRGRPRKTLDVKSWHWWCANGFMAVLFLPWLPVAYGQFTRVQGGFWIPPVNLYTLPNTIVQFLQFNPGAWESWLKLVVSGVVLGMSLLVLYLNKLSRKSIGLVLLWVFTAPLTVMVLSAIARPIYIDRYFVFAAVAFYALLGSVLYLKPLSNLPRLRPLLIIGIVVLLGFGVMNASSQSTHRMRELAGDVNPRFNNGDALVAGELYVYLDFSYYNETGTMLQLYAPSGISGYGETSLLYDKADQAVVVNYEQLKPSSGYVWVVGKTGHKGYFEDVPTSWSLVDHFEAGESAANRYRISAALAEDGSQSFCAQVITRGKNSSSGEVQDFSSSCLPVGWVPSP